MKSSKGYTFIEVIIILVIVMIMGTVPMLALSSTAEHIDNDQFLEQFLHDLQFARERALNSFHTVSVRFSTNPRTYSVMHRGEQLISREIPEHISFESGTLQINEMRFTNGGNIRKPGTLFIVSGDKHYRLTFRLGKGKFYIEQL